MPKRSPPEAGLAKYLYELGLLKRVQRSGWWLAGIKDAESVAEHSFRAAAIAYCLAELEGASAEKTLAMALFHDSAEARLSDLHRLARRYIDSPGAEEEVIADQTRSVPGKLAVKLRELLKEARGKASLEARIVKDADRLECLLQAREYAEQGYRVDEWIRSSLDELSTRSARRLGKAILKTRPSSWRPKA
jgi:putative hydrolase of HD superfamily